jgi:hypothetical protein
MAPASVTAAKRQAQDLPIVALDLTSTDTLASPSVDSYAAIFIWYRGDVSRRLADELGILPSSQCRSG